MSARPLSPTQRTAIRWIHDDPTGELVDAIKASTLRSLQTRQLIRLMNDNPVLTNLGERTYVEIMASGDGPEDLKERFNFLRPSGRRR